MLKSIAHRIFLNILFPYKNIILTNVNTGINITIDQNADILPKLLCQNIGENKGIKAIENKIPRNGIIENNDKFSPKLPVEAEIELNRIAINNALFLFIH